MKLLTHKHNSGPVFELVPETAEEMMVLGVFAGSMFQIIEYKGYKGIRKFNMVPVRKAQDGPHGNG